MKIFIANLPYKLEEAELKQMLTQYGQVASVKLTTDKETGRFGFIEMPVNDQAQKAINGLNGKKVYGREIALSQAEEKELQVNRNYQPSGGKRQRIGGREVADDDGEINGNR